MASTRKDNEKLQGIHADAKAEFEAIQSVMKAERLQCLEDRRFYSIAGAQWEGDLGEQFENKPKLEVNKTAMAVDQIKDDYYGNRIDAVFISKDGATDKSLADTCAALYRADEQDSCAEEAYDNAFEEAVAGGIGAWRLRTKFESTDGDDVDEYGEDEDDDTDDYGADGDEDGAEGSGTEAPRQRIQMEIIADADSSVFWDLNSKRQDKSDARTCFVVTSLTRTEFERRYPEEDPSTWSKDVHKTEFDWCTPDVVYIAEYYVVERVKVAVHVYRDALGTEVRHTQAELDADDGPEGLESVLLATGYTKVRTKKNRRKRIHKYLMTGNGILKDHGHIVGCEIPVVVNYGNRWFIDNIERCRGHVRLAKDPQRLKNMQLSKLAEISASSSIKKPIFTPAQVAGHENRWADDNTENYPYMLINPTLDEAGNPMPPAPVAYTQTADVPAALGALLQVADIDTKEVLGNPDQAEKLVSHVAGKTVEAVHDRVDRKSAQFIKNMGKAIRRSAQIWLGMAREVYTEPKRKMKGVGAQKELMQIELHKPMSDEVGNVTIQNDLKRALFDVTTTIGPASDSKRAAAVTKATDMMGKTADPETQAVLGNFALSQMEGEGIEDLRAWSRRKLVKGGVFKPTPDEAKELAAEAKAAQPSPNDKYLLAEAAKAEALAKKAEADTALIMAQIEKTKAETMKTLADIDLERGIARVDAAKSLHEMETTPLPASPGQPSGLGSA